MRELSCAVGAIAELWSQTLEVCEEGRVPRRQRCGCGWRLRACVAPMPSAPQELSIAR